MIRAYSQLFHVKQHEPISKTKTNIDTFWKLFEDDTKDAGS